LEAALDSLAAQTDPDYELLVVDDGSRDDSPERVRARAARDPRIRLLRTQADRSGLVAALELGRREARGEWILRMDADDLAHPRRLAWSRALLASDPRLGAVGTLVRSFPDHAVQTGRARYDAWLNGLRRHDDMARERFVESPLAHPSVLFRARAVAEVGGYRALEGPEDYDLWLRLLHAGWRLGKVPRLLLFWREGEQRASRQDPRYSAAGFTRVRAEALAQHLAGRPAAIVGAGAAGKRLAKALTSHGVEVRFFLDLDPRKIGRAPGGVPVLDHLDGLRQRRDEVLLTAVNARGARTAARTWLREQGLVEGEDFYLAS
jgi:glycosyltransferase involved in cell wall biosynthesis